MSELQCLEEPVELVMSSNLVTTDKEVSVMEAASIMAKKECGCIIVVSGLLAEGIVTERDIVRKVVADGVDPRRIQIQDIMSTPLITIKRTASVRETAEKMAAFSVRRIVIIGDNGNLVGLLTAGRLAAWLARQVDFANPALNAVGRTGRRAESPYQ